MTARDEQRRQQEMTDVDTLILAEFLLARIAEDEARAQELAETLPWRQGMHDAPGWDQDIVYFWPDGSGSLQWPSVSDGAAFIARFNPARILAECEAKRKIVAAYLDERARRDIYQSDDARAVEDERQIERRRSAAARCRGLEIAVEALASAYADHPVAEMFTPKSGPA